MAFRCKKCRLDTWYTHTFSKISLPWEGDSSLPHPPPLGHSAPSLCLPLINPGYTTVTGVAKRGTRALPPPPIDWQKLNKNGKRGSNNKSFYVPKKGHLDTKNCKKSLYRWGRGTPPTPGPPPHPPHTRSFCSLALAPRWQILATTVTAYTGIAKGHITDPCPPPPSPFDRRVKQLLV